VSEEKNNSGVFLIERRRAEKRILVHVPVEVTEVDSKGNAFTERTFIEDVSDFGCRFSTRGSVQQGDTVSVKVLGHGGKPLPDEVPRLYEVMWVARKEHGTTIGARLLQGEKLNKISSLPENGDPKHDAK
jgi:hypothetical protein